MSVINLLETLAKQSSFAHLSTEQLTVLVTQAELTADQQKAIINGDVEQLEQLLNLEPIKCTIVREDIPNKGDEPEETPDEEDIKTSSLTCSKSSGLLIFA